MQATHRLSDLFKNALLHGPLKPILSAVQNDDTLHLGIREDYISIYYRGWQLIKIDEYPSFTLSLDKGYDKLGSMIGILPKKITSSEDAEHTARAFRQLKDLMDRNDNIKNGSEREFQQILARVNNKSTHSNESHYFITDIEHNIKPGRIDMVGVKWHSKKRQNSSSLTPTIIEMKWGPNSINHTTGLKKHLEDALNYVLSPTGLSTLRANIESQFSQMNELGLINIKDNANATNISTTDRSVQMIFVLADYSPRSSQLHKALDDIEATMRTREPELDARGIKFDLLFAGASLCGYALYEESMLTLPELRERLSTTAPKPV